MKRVILDTNFILSCIRQKIDFFEEIPLLGLQIIIPEQIIKELKKIIDSKKKLHFKEEAKIALKLLEKNNFKKIDLKTKNVDTGIITLAKSDKDIIIATLDKEIKTRIQNQKLIIRGKKKLEII
ncbi:hypothetical protein DRN69_02105 [Candidatus Pacearchaeota archaeon]|nr:MAG: hypothetical protein DRN69_02105 [Candidatus Pacearchaeota archaeon]